GAVAVLHRQPVAGRERDIERVAGGGARAGGVAHAQRALRGRDPRGEPGAFDRRGHGAAERGLEAGGVDVGQVVRDRGLAAQRGAGAGHRDVEGLVHADLAVAFGRARCAHAPCRCNIRAAAARGAAPAGRSRRRRVDQRMLMTVWVSASWAWIICALAWKLRCAVIMFTSCSVRLTLEASSAPPWTAPNSAVPAAPRRARPEPWVSAQALSPIGCRPCGLAKLVSATWPSGVDTPLL